MIEPHHATRLGFCVDFRPGDRQTIEACVARLRGLGIRHVKVRLLASDIGDGSWFIRLLDRLRDACEILVCIPMIADFDTEILSSVLQACGDRVGGVELLDNPAEDVVAMAPAMLAGARIARSFDKTVVIGTSLTCRRNRLTAFGEAGLFALAGAIGLQSVDEDDGDCSIEGGLQTAMATILPFNAGLHPWLTAIGRSTWRHETARQARTFLASLSSSARRIYWHSLTDDPNVDQRDRAAHFGIDDASGAPKLLGRVLGGGVADVERIVGLSRRLPAPALVGSRPILVTGGAGFIGANLTDRLAAEGHHVLVFDALARPGVERNLRWLARRHPTRVTVALGDLRDEAATGEAAAGAAAIFHLAGQVAVTTSMVHPLDDFEINARGTLCLLEALRQRNAKAPLIMASTNKVYGDLADIELVLDGDRYLPRRGDIRAMGVAEDRPLCFHTPYGCSKGAADQYVLDYAHSFGLRTAVLRMSCIYGERQLGTEDQGWVAHFLLRAIAGDKLTIYGDGRQVRDVLHVGDAVGAYVAAWQNIEKIGGRVYNLGGGPANAISLLQLVDHIESMLGHSVGVEFSAWRPGDQRYFVADTTSARRDLSLPPALGWRVGLARLAEHFGAVIARTTPAVEAVL